jgi:hypothetical protein
MTACGSLAELPPALLVQVLLPLNARSIAAAACTCRALAAVASDGVLWRSVFARKWDEPRTSSADPRAAHVARKRLLRLLRQTAAHPGLLPGVADDPVSRVMACAAPAAELLTVCCCTPQFERSRRALERAPTLRWLLGAARAACEATSSQACGRLPAAVAPQALALACVATYAALGATVMRLEDQPGTHVDAQLGTPPGGAALCVAFHRVAAVLGQRMGGAAAAELCATAALAAAPVAAAAWLPAAPRAPAAGPWPAGARQPNDSAAARARREARPDSRCSLLTGAWAGLRIHPAPEAEGDVAVRAAPLALLLALNVTHETGAVSGWGHDALGSLDIVGRVHATPQAEHALLSARVSLRVSYRECGGLPGALIAHTVRGAAPMAWEGYVWPFGLVGAWAPEAPPAAGAAALWVQGGTFVLWPHAGGAVLRPATASV